MGLNSSGVRQIAQANATGDAEIVARTQSVLRRSSIALGVIGAFILACFSRQVSVLTFGDESRAGAIVLLSVAVLLRLVSDGQTAMLQGHRRILDFAKVGIIGTVLGAATSIALVWYLRQDGVAPSIVVAVLITACASWWYTRGLLDRAPRLSWVEAKDEVEALLKLGFTFMASSMMMMGTAYIVRLIVLRKIGFDATGLYQAAWVMGGLYIGFILQAMGADFYPRLTASASDHAACNRMVNEQTRVGLLLAGPGAIATLTMAPLLITVLYSSQFGPSVAILRWICLGATLQAITWPMGFIILAKGERNVFFWTELAWSTVNVALAWVCVEFFGLTGSGMAFFGSYLFHVCQIYPIVHRLTGFRWDRKNLQIGSMFLMAITGVFLAFELLPWVQATVFGAVALFLSTLYSVRSLLTLVTTQGLPGRVTKLLTFARLMERPAQGY
jgi:PST family polysaccharide transporter